MSFAIVFVAASSGTLAGGSTFESGDGNLVVNGGSAFHDWNSPVESIACGNTIPGAGTNCGLDLVKNQADNALGQGSKEDDVAPTVVNGSIPPSKDDLSRFYVNKERVGGNDYLYLAWERSNLLGSAHMDFEFNQSSTLSANGVTPQRTAGDLLIDYDFGGSGVPVIAKHNWITSGNPATDCEASNTLPCWDKGVTLGAFAEAQVNSVPVVDTNPPGAPRTLDGNTKNGINSTFGEAGINLTGSGIFLPNVCKHFGAAYLKSRSSGNSFSSELKDFISPIPVDISNCGVLKIVKVTDPSSDTTTQFPFTVDDGALTNAGLPKNFNLVGGGSNSTDVLAGTTYSAEETSIPSGWTLRSASCDNGSGTLSGGKLSGIVVTVDTTTTCTFTNQARGTIAVKKVTVPATDTTTQFSFAGDAGSQTLTNGQTSTPVSVVPGTYTETEAAKTGWDLTSLTCNDSDSTGSTSTRIATFHVAAGENVVCTYTNTQRGTIAVKKVTVPATDTTTQFSFSGDAGSQTLTNGQTSTPVSVAPASYSETEDAKIGWDLTNVSCSDSDSTGSTTLRSATFVVAPGENVVCTFTNTQRGHLLIDKVTIPSGDPQSFSFTSTGGPDSINQSFSLTDAAAPHDSGAIRPGTYAAGETVPAGWDFTSATCSNGSGAVSGSALSGITVGAGETVTCTFTNTKQGTIAVKKVTVPTSDTTTQFTFSGDAGSQTLTNGQTSTPVSVVPGTYTETEAAKTGWDLTSISCNDSDSTGDKTTRTATFNVAAGENVVCTYTNTERAKITVLKVDDTSVADGGPNPLPGAQFQLISGILVVDTCTTGADGKCSFSNVVPGTYTLHESVVPDAQHAAAPDQTVTVGAGDDVTFTFVDPRLHKVIVLVCHEGTNTLAASAVTGADVSGTTLAHGASLPTGVDEAKLCGLGGATGTHLGHISTSATIDVGSLAH